MTDAQRWQLARENVARAEQERIEGMVNVEFDRLQAVERFALVACKAQEYDKRQQAEITGKV